MKTLKLYFAIAKKEFQRASTYKGNILSGVLSSVMFLAAQYALWRALYETGNAYGSTFQETMTFYIINNIILTWITISFSDPIGADIRSGDIAQRLIKPVPYRLQLLAVSHGRAFFETLTRTLPMFLLSILFIKLQPPFLFMPLSFS